MGKPKQNLVHRGKTLLQHVIDEAINASLHPIVIVTGGNAEQVSPGLQHQPVYIAYNPNWQQGIATSIVQGVAAVTSLQPAIDNLILAVCDQPFISFELFRQLIEKQMLTNKSIVACSYADTIGTPVLFQQIHFKDLLQLNGDEGAKTLFSQYKGDIATILFEKGNIDVDTVDDYEALCG